MTVLNKHHSGIPPGAIYIGRGSIWGNPFIIGKHGDRDAVCEQYEQYLENQVNTGQISIEQLAALHNQKLVCFCAPLRCHGHTLEKAAAWAVRQLDIKESV